MKLDYLTSVHLLVLLYTRIQLKRFNGDPLLLMKIN